MKPFVAAGRAGEGECAFENRPRPPLPPGHRCQRRRRRRGRIALWVEGEGEEREGGGRGWRGERRPRIRPAHSSHFHICQITRSYFQNYQQRRRQPPSRHGGLSQGGLKVVAAAVAVAVAANGSNRGRMRVSVVHLLHSLTCTIRHILFSQGCQHN